MVAQINVSDDISNPLDSVEEILTSNNWVFNRMNDEELIVQVKGKACDYRLFFIWQEDMNAMQFCCQYDMVLNDADMVRVGATLMDINENLWMGHFDLPRDTKIPSFRHTSLLRGVSGMAGVEHIEDLVDVSLAQCERYYPAFYLLANTKEAANDQNIALALMDIAGES